MATQSANHRGANHRAFDLDRIRRNAAALRRRERLAEQLRVIVPVAALAITFYLAMQHLVLQDIPALQAMIDHEVSSRCLATSCTCTSELPPGQPPAIGPVGEEALYAGSDPCALWLTD
jgi:hypothetical protein